MIALSDQSSMPLLPVWALPLLLLLAATILFWRGLPKRTPPASPTNVAQLHPEHCSTTGCNYPARVPVESFVGRVVVCHGCADEGITHGWFYVA